MKNLQHELIELSEKLEAKTIRNATWMLPLSFACCCFMFFLFLCMLGAWVHTEQELQDVSVRVTHATRAMNETQDVLFSNESALQKRQTRLFKNQEYLKARLEQ